jgi:DNA repair exonuclease SbcCD ATPase subunit
MLESLMDDVQSAHQKRQQNQQELCKVVDLVKSMVQTLEQGTSKAMRRMEREDERMETIQLALHGVTCSICTREERLHSNRLAIITPCGHGLWHYDCVDTWAKQQSRDLENSNMRSPNFSCPICRKMATGLQRVYIS